MRKGNIEFRYSKINKKYELVKWKPVQGEKKESCYVIAFFDKHKEGYDLRTVGERFFEDHDAWVLGKYVLQFLNAIFNHEEEEKDG